MPIYLNTSLPSRGAWIEIMCGREIPYYITSLPSRGAWIEIRESVREIRSQKRRSPRGERGLKFLIIMVIDK